MLATCKGNIHHTPAMLEVMPATKYVLQVRYLESKMGSVHAITKAWLLNGSRSPFHSSLEAYFVVTLLRSICPYGVTSVLHIMVHKTLQTRPICHHFITYSLHN